MSETSGEDDAVRAFEGLKSEVARLRQGIELVYRQSEEAAVDYSPTLGEMAKTLAAVQSRLAAIEGKPGLGVTPQMFRQQIEEAGHRAGEQAGRAMVEGAAAQSAATRELQALVGRARTRKDQWEWLGVAVGGGIILGMILVRVLVAVLPWGGGDGLAAVMVGARDPWEAGEILMQDANRASFDKMATLYNTCGPRPVAFCTTAIVLDEAAKAGTGSGAEALPHPPAPPGRR
jgi:hypothetical protein